MNTLLSLPRWGLIFLLMLLPAVAVASDNRINTGQDGIAIHGYDPVAYFTAGKPVKGLSKLGHEWSGASWLFSSEDNRQLFISDPEKYAPQYGGYCAYAASYAKYADTDPQAWTIINDKLYLNYSLRVRDTWKPRAAEFISDADQSWLIMEAP